MQAEDLKRDLDQVVAGGNDNYVKSYENRERAGKLSVGEGPHELFLFVVRGEGTRVSRSCYLALSGAPIQQIRLGGKRIGNCKVKGRTDSDRCGLGTITG
jgi:hypothetical protein